MLLVQGTDQDRSFPHNYEWKSDIYEEVLNHSWRFIPASFLEADSRSFSQYIFGLLWVA